MSALGSARIDTHNSTHLDAPYRYNSTIAGRPAQTIDQLPLDWFCRPGVDLDFHDRADGETIDAADLEVALDKAGRELAERDIVLIRTGRDAYYSEPDYMQRGPGVSATATHWLYDRGRARDGHRRMGWDRPLCCLVALK